MAFWILVSPPAIIKGLPPESRITSAPVECSRALRDAERLKAEGVQDVLAGRVKGNRMRIRRCIQFGGRRMPALFQSRDIVAGDLDPLPCRNLRRALPDPGLNFRNARQFRIGLVRLFRGYQARMDVTLNESRNHRFPTQLDDLRVLPGVPFDLRVAADG